MFALENEGQGRGGQHSQWRHLMANINLGKSHTMHFGIAIIVSKILTIHIADQHEVQHLQWSHSMANINLYKNHRTHFFASYHHFRDKCIHLSNS